MTRRCWVATLTFVSFFAIALTVTAIEHVGLGDTLVFIGVFTFSGLVIRAAIWDCCPCSKGKVIPIRVESREP